MRTGYTVYDYQYTVHGIETQIVATHRTDSEEVAQAYLMRYIRKYPQVQFITRTYNTVTQSYEIETETF